MVLDIRSIALGQVKSLSGRSEKTIRKKQKTGATGSDSAADDSVEITGQSAQIARLVDQMKSQPVLDPDRVAPVKEKLDKGEYQLKYEQIANKMLDFESSW